MTDLLQLLLNVLPFALASMVSPLAIITVMAVLSTSTRRAFRAVLFATAYITVFAAISLLLVAFGSLAAAAGKPSAVSASVDLVLGVILVYAGARSLRRPSASHSLDPAAMGTGAIAAMGVAFSASNLSSLLPALAASKDIGIAVVPPVDKAIAFIFMLVIAVSWVWVPVALYLAAPDHFDQYLNPLIRFLQKHGGQLMAAVFFVIGVYLLIRAVSDLARLYSVAVLFSPFVH